jgi:hypothetical protein
VIPTTTEIGAVGKSRVKILNAEFVTNVSSRLTSFDFIERDRGFHEGGSQIVTVRVRSLYVNPSSFLVFEGRSSRAVSSLERRDN